MDDYCGPYYFPKWLKKHLSVRFNLACSLHDQRYDLRVQVRKDIDRQFLRDMLYVATTFSDKVVARVYYRAVRLFGWISYKRGK